MAYHDRLVSMELLKYEETDDQWVIKYICEQDTYNFDMDETFLKNFAVFLNEALMSEREGFTDMTFKAPYKETGEDKVV